MKKELYFERYEFFKFLVIFLKILKASNNFFQVLSYEQ